MPTVQKDERKWLVKITMENDDTKQVYLLFCTLTEVMILSSYNVNVTLHHVYAR